MLIENDTVKIPVVTHCQVPSDSVTLYPGCHRYMSIVSVLRQTLFPGVTIYKNTYIVHCINPPLYCLIMSEVISQMTTDMFHFSSTLPGPFFIHDLSPVL